MGIQRLFILLLFYLHPIFYTFGQSKNIKIYIHTSPTIIDKQVECTIFQNNKEIFSKTFNLKDSSFSLQTSNKGLYQLIVQSPSCGLVQRYWQADTIAYQYAFHIKLSEKIIQLEQITVHGGSRIKQNGDTLIIKTDDIQTRPHADATAIFDKISGLQVGLAGDVSILGKSVQEITIDGKKIFGGIPILVLNNIRSDMIQQMEFVEKTLANGEKSNQLNLRLKKNRKNGGYGDISSGIGIPSNYLLGGHYNKINGSSFTNAFFTSNNINEQGIATKDIERITFNSFRNSLNRTSSVIGLYDNQNIVNLSNDENLNKEFLGKSNIINSGVNFTYTGKKSNFDTFIFFDKNKQELTQYESRKTFLGQSIQSLNDSQHQNNDLRILNFSLNDKTKLSEKITLQISNHLNVNEKHTTLSDSTISNINQTLNNFIFAKRNTENQEWSNNLQSSISRNGNKKGFNTSFYFNFFHQSPIENNKFQNTYSFLDSTRNGTVEKDINLDKIQLQLIQSFPLSKHFLIEGKVSNYYENNQVTQKTFSQNSILSDTFTSGNIDIKNIKQEYGTYILYQQPKYSSIIGLSYLHWASERNGYQERNFSYNFQKQLFLLPIIRFNYRFSLKSSLSLQYHTNFILPNWRNVINIPDSSNIVNFSIGNINLQPYIDRNIELNNNHSIGNGFQLNYSINYHWYKNYIINENFIGNENGIVNNSFINSENPIQSIGFNFFALKIGIRSRLSWAIFGAANHFNSYQKTINQIDNTSITSILSTNVFFTSQSVKWNASDKITFQFDWRTQGNYTNNSLNWTNVISAKNDYQLGKNWFLNTSTKLAINNSKISKNNFQPFVDFKIDKYLFKNNGLCLSVLVKNIFNFDYETTISQSTNQQVVLMNNYLPRLFLLKLTFYPESWK